jgi:serine/threonine-protein kinase
VNAKQGIPTDIYAVCAVLYRVLSGCAPVDAQSRYEADVIQPIYLINKRIPKSVSDVIMQGLRMDINDRPQNINEFSHNLFRYIEFELKKSSSSSSTGRFKTEDLYEDCLEYESESEPQSTSIFQWKRKKRRRKKYKF